ncbi:MAG: hypothetical protein J0L93_00965 [Deltaproteobacteria bacterium]|nr:hypothetical protein [Deltaproteobacteria bacterium]
MSSYLEMTQRLGLEPKHFTNQSVDLPVIDSHIYTTLGRRLFEFYKKYSIDVADQRELEALSFILIAFTMKRNEQPSLFKRIKNFFVRRSS